MNFPKKALAGFLAAAMLSMAGCSGSDTSWAYRSGEIAPPIGLYIFYLMDSAATAEEKYHEQHGDEENHEHPAYKDLLKEPLPDGQTFEAFMLEDAAQSMREYVAVEQKFAEMGLSLSESERTYAAEAAASTWSGNQAYYEDNGIAESTLRLGYENGFKKQAVFTALYQSGGERAVSEEELRSAFEKDYAKVEYILFPKAAVTGGDADDAAIRAEAEGYLGRLQNGENFYDLVFEQLKAAAGDSADTVERPAEGSRSMIVGESHRGTYYSDELVDSALAAPIGEPVLAEDTTYYYILVRGDVLEDATNFASFRNEVLLGLKGDEFEELVTSWASGVTLEANQAALNRYTPAKLKMD